MFHNIINNCHSPSLFLLVSNNIDEGYDDLPNVRDKTGQEYIVMMIH